jgi:hypothetical protein
MRVMFAASRSWRGVPDARRQSLQPLDGVEELSVKIHEDTHDITSHEFTAIPKILCSGFARFFEIL